MVDYSKWDKFNDYDSEEESEMTKPSKNVQITTLPKETGGKVTIGPQGYYIHDDNAEETLPTFHEVHQTILENERQKASNLEDETNDLNNFNEDEEEAKFYEEQKQLYLKQQQQPKLQHESSKLNTSLDSLKDNTHTLNEMRFIKSTSHKIDPSLRTKNGNSGEYQNIPYEWSQTHYEATVYLYLSPEVLLQKLSDPTIVKDFTQLKKRDFVITYQEEDRNFQLSYRHRPIIGKEDIFPLISGKLHHEIELAGDPKNPYDDIIDWEVQLSAPATHLPSFSLTSSTSPAILTFEIVFRKQRKFTNAIIWWVTIFTGEPTIDPTTIKERSKNYAEFMNNFRIANEEFVKKMKNADKIEI